VETAQLVFNGIVALALILQGIALLIIARKVRELAAKLDATSAKLTRQIDALAVQAESFLEVAKETAVKLHAVQDNLATISRIVHDRVIDVDAFLKEVTSGARLQMARLEDIMQTAARRIDDTIDAIQTAIVTPVGEVQAVIRGIRAGLTVLFGLRRASGDRSHQDEEMFI
jgi:uncharacterized protein YoxC